MTVIYWLLGFSVFGAALCSRVRGAVMPALVFTVLAIVFALMTPAGQEVASWFHSKAPVIAQSVQ
jgi:hypothetical protein